MLVAFLLYQGDISVVPRLHCPMGRKYRWLGCFFGLWAVHDDTYRWDHSFLR